MQHLSDFKLSITLLLMTLLHTSHADSSYQDTVRTCIGDNANFTLAYEVPPFYAVEWLMGTTQIAETSEETLSQDSLSISENYKSRFLLLKNGSVGFIITNVTKDDAGEYTCSVTLKSTADLKGLITKLQVTDCPTNDTSTKGSNEDGKTTIPSPTPTPAEDTNVLGIVLGVCIACGVIALLGVSLCLYRRRKGRCLGNHKEAGRRTNSPVPGSHVERKGMLDERV